jgi:hypothetical protein
MASAWVIIEVHERFRPGVEALLRERFGRTHELEVARPGTREPGDFPELAALPDDARARAAAETRTGDTPWFLFTPR